MVSVGMSAALANFFHAAHTNGNEKPTPTPADDGRGDDRVWVGPYSGHAPLLESSTPYSSLSDKELHEYFHSQPTLRELLLGPKDIDIDSDIPRPNPKDNGPENQAEIYDPVTKTWQPT